MDFSDQLRALRERWLLVVLAVVAGLACAGAAYAAEPEEYTASLTMYVSAPGSQDPSAAALNGQLAQQRVKSYVELVDSRPVAEEIVRTLALPYSPEELSSRISASNPLDSVVLSVEVTDSSQQRAVDEANAFGTVFGRTASGLDTASGVVDASTLTLRVVAPATVTPSSPGPAVVLGLGLLGGLVVGVCGALLARRLDRRVRTAEALHGTTGLPVLGTLPRRAGVDRDGAVTDRMRPIADDVRRLRAGLVSAAGTRVPRSILVASARPGEGRTTVVIGLALLLSSIGQRVLVVDADLRRPRIDELLGLGPAAGLSSVLTGQAGLDQAVRPWNGRRFDVLGSGPVPEDPGPLCAGAGMRSLIADLGAAYDVVLLDSSPVLPVVDAVDLAAHVDAVLLLATPDSARDDVASAVRTLGTTARHLLGVVLTMAPPERRRRSDPYVGDPASPLMSADRPVPSPWAAAAGPRPPRLRPDPIPVPRPRDPGGVPQTGAAADQPASSG